MAGVLSRSFGKTTLLKAFIEEENVNFNGLLGLMGAMCWVQGAQGTVHAAKI